MKNQNVNQLRRGKEMIDLRVGMKCYSSTLSLHVDEEEFKYKAPRGKKFAVILMTDEKADNLSGIYCDEFLRGLGWELASDKLSLEKENMHGWIDCPVKNPENQTGLWSEEVAEVSNLGDVFKLSCMDGYWQRTTEFIDSGATSITHWMPLPAQKDGI